MHVDRETIKGQMADFLKIPAGRMDDTMQLTSIADSMMLVELLIEMQEQYGMRLIQADLENINTVSELTGLIAARAQR